MNSTSIVSHISNTLGLHGRAFTTSSISDVSLDLLSCFAIDFTGVTMSILLLQILLFEIFKESSDISCISSIALAIAVEFAFEEQGIDIILEFAVKMKRSEILGSCNERLKQQEFYIYKPALSFLVIRLENNREYFSACLQEDKFFLHDIVRVCNDCFSLCIDEIVSSKLIRDTIKFPLNFDPCEA